VREKSKQVTKRWFLACTTDSQAFLDVEGTFDVVEELGIEVDIRKRQREEGEVTSNKKRRQVVR
jgi:hypothetical protein